MADRMEELQGGCYALQEAPCIHMFYLKRDTSAANGVVTFSNCPGCCFCCIPNPCPEAYSNKRGGLHGGWLQNTEKKSEVIAWQSPESFLMFGPTEPLEGTKYAKFSCKTIF